MSNDSTTAGYLTPVGDAPVNDQELERIISRWITGVSGLPGNYVFPRFTDPQPQIPPNGVTWCGFGVTALPQALFPAERQISDDQAEHWSWEEVNVISCFYGPQGAETAAIFRAGIFIEQNNAELNRTGLSLRGIGDKIYNLPELINNQWVRRYDLTVTLSRKTIRTYNIRTLLEAPVQFFGD